MGNGKRRSQVTESSRTKTWIRKLAENQLPGAWELPVKLVGTGLHQDLAA